MRNANMLTPKFVSIDTCLLVMRILTAVLLFSKHGYEKIFHFQEMLGHFPDPLGIGKLPGLIYATITDACCTVLIVLGLFNRVAVLLILINLLVAFIGVHQISVNDHGELMLLYIINLSFLFFAGPGKISFDDHYNKTGRLE